MAPLRLTSTGRPSRPSQTFRRSPSEVLHVLLRPCRTPSQGYSNWRCLVTGASSGLGRSLAAALVHQGARVVMTGRSRDRLEAAAAPLRAEFGESRVRWIAADLTSDADRDRLLEETASHFGGVLDLAINSAGVGATGHFDTHHPDVLRRIFAINLIALAEVSRGVLPLLQKSEHPSLVNIGSIVARRGLPGRAAYTSSKFAVAGFTESIRAEWAKYGIHVMLLNPGFTATEFDRNLLTDTAIYPVTHRRHMTPEAVASATLPAIQKRKNELTLTYGGRLLILVNRLIPRFVDWGLNRWTLHLFPDAPILQTRRRSS